MDIRPDDTSNNDRSVIVVDNSDLAHQHYFADISKHYNASFFTSTEQAWELLTRAPLPDAIILDISISQGDSEGMQFCHRLKESPYFSNIPVIFLSALNDPSIKSKAFSLGCADFLSKPFDVEELFARLNNHIQQYRRTKKLESLVFIDPLTHLPNSMKFNEVLRQEWSRCARYWHHLALILVHVNNMDMIRDEHGLDECYAVTASIADDLRSVGARPGDLFASLDNDTFALLLSDCSIDGAKLKVSQIEQKLAHPHFMANHQSTGDDIKCTLAYTVAAPAGGSSSDELITTTKALLVEAKIANDRQVFHSPDILGIDGLTHSANL